MLFSFADKADVSGTRKTADGYLVADARVGRIGIYDYAGSEMGRPDMPIVRVFRPEESVFDAASMASLAHKPLTNDHPVEDVSASNWKKLAIGMADGEVKRDGEFIRVPMMLTDAKAISDYEAGKVELSPGYRCDIAFTPGDHNGAAYDAVMGPPTYNHIALVDAARGGSHCRIGDSWPSSTTKTQPKEKPMPIMLDGLKVDIADAEAVQAAFTKLQGQVADAVTAKGVADTAVAELTTKLSTADAKVITLEQAVKDAAVTPAKMRDAAAAYARTLDTAKKLGATVTDAMDEAAIQKATVDHKLGDAAKDWSEAQIATSFTTLAASVVVDGNTARDAIMGIPANSNDAKSVRDKAIETRNAGLRTAYQGK